MLKQGASVFHFANMIMGEDSMRKVLHKEESLRLPRGFWPSCCRNCFDLHCTRVLRTRLRKALNVYIVSLRNGATTTQGRLADRRPDSRRSGGAAFNRVLCPELGQLLYDWFIDTIQHYKARVNGPLILWKARELRLSLIDTYGYKPQDMPNLEKSAGDSWFKRWRKNYDVVKKKNKASQGLVEKSKGTSESIY